MFIPPLLPDRMLPAMRNDSVVLKCGQNRQQIFPWCPITCTNQLGFFQVIFKKNPETQQEAVIKTIIENLSKLRQNDADKNLTKKAFDSLTTSIFQPLSDIADQLDLEQEKREINQCIWTYFGGYNKGGRRNWFAIHSDKMKDPDKKTESEDEYWSILEPKSNPKRQIN